MCFQFLCTNFNETFPNTQIPFNEVVYGEAKHNRDWYMMLGSRYNILDRRFSEREIFRVLFSFDWFYEGDVALCLLFVFHYDVVIFLSQVRQNHSNQLIVGSHQRVYDQSLEPI